MTLDDLILWLQRGADRLIRRLRLEPSPRAAARRLLVIQIDGLSRTVFEHALGRNRLRTLKRLLRRGQLVFRPMSVGIPSSTPAFQAGLFYGVNPDIPAFTGTTSGRARTSIFLVRVSPISSSDGTPRVGGESWKAAPVTAACSRAGRRRTSGPSRGSPTQLGLAGHSGRL